jgi:hypothetical protein
MESRPAISPVLAIVVVVVIVAAAAGAYYLVAVPPSALPRSVLRMDVTPPGYPIPGNDWTVQVWQSYLDGNFTPASNATVILESNGTNFEATTDANGVAAVTYQNSLGGVTILAEKSGFATAVFTPVVSYVSSDNAWEVMGSFFALGVLANVTLVLRTGKAVRRKGGWLSGLRGSVELALSAVVVVTFLFGLALSLVWLSQWSLGSSYGYSNQIILGLDYSHDLIGALVFLLVASALLTIVGSVKPSKGTK